MIRFYMHTLQIRIWHWVNLAILLVLIVTGEYIRFYGIASLKPNDPFLLWHKWLGVSMIFTTFLWYAFALLSRKHRRHYQILKGDMAGILSQIRYYLFAIFKGEENPFNPTAEQKYNPIQKTAYLAVMCIVLPMLAITGLFCMDVPFMRDFIITYKLVKPISILHMTLAYIVVIFLIIHIYMTTLGETIFSHLKAMITGYEEQSSEKGNERKAHE